MIYSLCDARWAYQGLHTHHYCDAIMGAMASQITSVSTVWSAVCSGADQRKHQSSASPALVRGIHRSPVDSPHKRAGTRKMFPFVDVIMQKSEKHCLIPFQMSLCQTVTILVYLSLVRLVYCFNISWIQPIEANEFHVKTNMGIRHITPDLLRNYVNMTVRKERIISHQNSNIAIIFCTIL